MTSAVPLISVTNPTPPRPFETSNANNYRLLYRGALSLPDSHLLLDGLTFAARLDTPSKHNHLLQNPLALALESMRGRPSLRFMGVVKLGDDNVWLDDSGGIELDIHPNATLTRIYFENLFCLIPFASTSKSTSTSQDKSDIGIKVALGDSDGPDTTEIIICAHNNQGNRALQLIVARIAPRPVHQPNLLRLPRPDDPTPKETADFPWNWRCKRRDKKGADTKTEYWVRLGRSRAKKDCKLIQCWCEAIENRSGRPRQWGSLGEEKQGKKGLFKVPQLPSATGKAKGKGKARLADESDVFGGMDMAIDGLNRKGQSEGKGKRKRNIDDDGTGDNDEVMEIERANKNAIKRCALENLSSTKDPTASRIDKAHPEFKDIFGWVYRGVGFALRAQIKAQPVDEALIERLIKMHITMYVGGHGGLDSLRGLPS